MNAEATQTATAPFIDVSTVTKRFGSARSSAVIAVEGVSFSVCEREFVCVVGPSGCGKTTLLRMLAGLTPPSAGDITIQGEDVRKLRKRIAMVFQSPVLLPWRTALDNVLLPACIRKLELSAYRERANQLLDLVGLTGFAQSYPHELSGGMQQRVALARALLTDPDILLMDEPFGALDAITRQVLNLELTRIWQADRKTVVLITHDISEAVFLADRIFVMSRRPGRILDQIRVEIARPRSFATTTAADFGQYVRTVHHLLGLGDVGGDRNG